ncbi:Prismane, partial [Candidatus Magnetoovum chiemensis]
IDANGMVMRNVVHLNLFGAAAYTYHAKEAIKTLKSSALGKSGFAIKNEELLNSVAKTCGISTGNGSSAAKTAEALADFFWTELHRDSSEESKMVEIFAPQSRKKLWRDLGIFPGGPLHETVDTESRCMTKA